MTIKYQSTDNLMTNEFEILTHPSTGEVVLIKHHNSHGGQIAARKLGEKLIGRQIDKSVVDLAERVESLEKKIHKLAGKFVGLHNKIYLAEAEQNKQASILETHAETISDQQKQIAALEVAAKPVPFINPEMLEEQTRKFNKARTAAKNPDEIGPEAFNLGAVSSVIPNRITLERNQNGTWSAYYDNGMTPIAKKLIDYLTRLRN